MDLLDITLSDVLRENREKYPNDIAYIFDGIIYSWKDIDEITDLIALKLLEKGIEKGTHVGIWSINSIEQVCMIYAVMKIGSIATIFNYSYKDLEMESVLKYADTEYLFYGESTGSVDYFKTINKINKNLPKLKDYFNLLDIFNWAIKFKKGNQEIEEDLKLKLERVKNSINSKDISCMLFTSGSTQLPKGVLLSHHNILNNARILSNLMRWDRKEDKMLIAMPIFHCSGMTCGLLLGLMIAMPVVIMRKYKPKEAMKIIEEYKITAFNAVPSMLMLLIESPSFGKYDISSWNSGILAGSGIMKDKYLEFVNKIKLPHLQIGYGQTETSPLITLSDYDDDIVLKSETIGLPIPNMEVRIWDNDKNCECGENIQGEIQTRGFCTMHGYYNIDEKNKAKYTEDGWLKTDDFGYCDENGYFHFVGRMSDMIVRGGENISPSEIECVIKHYSEDILDVKVVGVDVQTAAQEEIIAFVNMKPDKDIDGEGLKKFVKSQLASYKTPNYIFQLDNFPMNSTGKIDLVAIKKLAKDKIMEKNNMKRCFICS